MEVETLSWQRNAVFRLPQLSAGAKSRVGPTRTAEAACTQQMHRMRLQQCGFHACKVRDVARLHGLALSSVLQHSRRFRCAQGLFRCVYHRVRKCERQLRSSFSVSASSTRKAMNFSGSLHAAEKKCAGNSIDAHEQHRQLWDFAGAVVEGAERHCAVGRRNDMRPKSQRFRGRLS